MREGRRIAVIVNDHGENLVDELIMKSNGLPTGKVIGGCFCCKFQDFMDSLNHLVNQINPSVVLAEAVGCCTDLLATVYAPLRRYYSDSVSLSPYIVLVDPLMLMKYFDEKNETVAFPSVKMAMLLTWQLKEADVIAINKIDAVPPESIERIENFLRKINESCELVRISAKYGHNINKIRDIVLHYEHGGKSTITHMVDYESYAVAEKECVWFEGTFKIVSNSPQDLGRLISELLLSLYEKVKSSKGTILHAKVGIPSNEKFLKASITSSGKVDIIGSTLISREAIIVMNIRVMQEPETIKSIIGNCIKELSSRSDVTISELNSIIRIPPHPEPQFRLEHT